MLSGFKNLSISKGIGDSYTNFCAANQSELPKGDWQRVKRPATDGLDGVVRFQHPTHFARIGCSKDRRRAPDTRRSGAPSTYTNVSCYFQSGSCRIEQLLFDWTRRGNSVFSGVPKCRGSSLTAQSAYNDDICLVLSEKQQNH